MFEIQMFCRKLRIQMMSFGHVIFNNITVFLQGYFFFPNALNQTERSGRNSDFLGIDRQK